MHPRKRLTGMVWAALRRAVMFRVGLSDRWFDLRYRTETAGWVELDELDIASGNKAWGKRYQPSQAGQFRTLLSRAQFPQDGGFVDLGAGKGKALFLAAQYGFRRVVGVEFSHELCDTAARNIAAFRRVLPDTVEIQILESDVADYEIRDDDNVFFLANSFMEPVMKRTLDNISASLAAAPRQIWFAYHNPVLRQMLDDTGLFETTREYRFGWLSDPYVVYTTHADGA